MPKVIDCYVDLRVALNWKSDSMVYDLDQQISEFLEMKIRKSV